MKLTSQNGRENGPVLQNLTTERFYLCVPCSASVVFTILSYKCRKELCEMQDIAALSPVNGLTLCLRVRSRSLAVAIMTNFKLFDCHQQIAFRIGLTVQTAGNEW